MNILTVDDLEGRHESIAFRLRPLVATYRRRYHADDPTDADLAWADVVFLDHDMCQRDYRGGIVLEPDPKRNCPNPIGKAGPLAACGCPSGANLARRMAEGVARPRVVVHTANPPGGAEMVATLERAGFRVLYAPASRWHATDWDKVRAFVEGLS